MRPADSAELGTGIATLVYIATSRATVTFHCWRRLATYQARSMHPLPKFGDMQKKLRKDGSLTTKRCFDQTSSAWCGMMSRSCGRFSLPKGAAQALKQSI